MRELLNAVLVRSAQRIDLIVKPHGLRSASVDPSTLAGFQALVLTVRAQVPLEQLANQFLAQAKFAPTERLPELVRLHLPGLHLANLPVPPRQIPYSAGTVYFHIEPRGPLWQQLVTHGGMSLHVAGEIPNLEIRLRAGNTEKVKASLERAEIAPGDRPSGASGSAQGLAHERRLIEKFATHHQKTILIDYEREQGRKAVGYVMGLNSVTDYWDSAAHHFNDPRREVDWACKSELAKALGSSQTVSRDPYQDYAARLRGEALQDVERNFSSAWQRAQPGRKPLAALNRQVPLKLPVRPGPGRRIQVVRTQPEEGDHTIQRAYWQATRSARSYIYIENQYFYFEAWARHLKATRQVLMAALARQGIDKKKAGMLHIFVVIPKPEDDGMVPRTYDTVKSLGQAHSMPGQDKAVNDESRRHAAQQTDHERQLTAWRQSGGNLRGHPMPPAARTAIYESAVGVQAPQENAEGELGYVDARTMQFEGLGLKVLLARMVSFNDAGHEGHLSRLKPEQNYRQVYIHSKLAIVDDTWFTLGSANLNVRSMAADSEINVSVENGTVAADLRRRVWGLMTGGAHAGGGGTPKEVEQTFKDWKDLMELNKAGYEVGTPLKSGFLIPFEDERVIEFRHG